MVTERYQELLKQLKMLVLGFDNATRDADSEEEIDNQQEWKELVLDWTLKKVTQDVANYTNIPADELPVELDGTLVAIAAQFISSHELLMPVSEKSSNIQSLGEGDTSVTFRSPSDIYSTLQATNTVSDNFVGILNNFRRVSFEPFRPVESSDTTPVD